MDEVERMADMVTEYLPWKLPRTRLFEPCDACSIRGVCDRESASGPDIKHRSHRSVPCGDGTAALLSSGPPKPTLERNIHRIGPCSRGGGTPPHAHRQARRDREMRVPPELDVNPTHWRP